MFYFFLQNLVWVCRTFQARGWLSWTIRTEKPWLTDTPCSCIGAEASTCICSITVSKDANINWFVRPGRSYTVPASCTIATWLLEASSATKLARQTWSAATIMEKHLKCLPLNLRVRFTISFQKYVKRHNKWERLSLSNWDRSCRNQSPVLLLAHCDDVWNVLLLCVVRNFKGSFTFEQATSCLFLLFVAVSRPSGKCYLSSFLTCILTVVWNYFCSLRNKFVAFSSRNHWQWYV